MATRKGDDMESTVSILLEMIDGDTNGDCDKTGGFSLPGAWDKQEEEEEEEEEEVDDGNKDDEESSWILCCDRLFVFS